MCAITPYLDDNAPAVLLGMNGSGVLVAVGREVVGGTLLVGVGVGVAVAVGNTTGS